MKIVTDSGADLLFEPRVVQALGVETVPLRVSINDRSYREDVDINCEDFYKLLTSTNALPVTSPPSVNDFVRVYKRIAQEDPDILSIHISSGLSETYNEAIAAAKQVPEARITHYDAKSLSVEVGWMIEAASKAIRAGWPTERILPLMDTIKENSETILTLNELKYLINGGRISHLRGLMANLLNIKPILCIEKSNGTLSQLGQERTYEKALKGLLKYISTKHKKGSQLRMQVVHSFSHESAAEFKYELDKHFDVSWLPVGAMSLVLGAHTGPSMVGVAFADQSIFDKLP